MTSLNKKINANKTKHLLVENEVKKLKAFNSSYFRGRNTFEEDGTQNYLVFQPMYKYLKKIGNINHISSWESKGLSDEINKPPTTPNNSLAATLKYSGRRILVKFNESCLKQDKITFNHGTIVNINIAYDLKSTLDYNEDITLENCLFGAVKLTKNADISKCKYSGYGIGFDGKGALSHPSDGFGKNSIIFEGYMSSSVHVDNKKKDILILGEGLKQGLDDTTSTAEKMYSINFTVTKNKFCLSWHYDGANSYLFVNGTKIIEFKAKDSEVGANPLCLGNISEDFSAGNIKKIGSHGYVFDFSVDYDTIAVDEILDIHKYLMEKNNIK